MDQPLKRWSCMIGKSYKEDTIVYHGDVLAWDRYINGEEAHNYYTRMQQNHKRLEPVVFSAFGENRELSMPTLPPEKIEKAQEISSERYDEIVRMTTGLLILDDRIIAFWQRFLKEYSIYEYEKTIYLRPREEKIQAIGIDQMIGE